MGEEGDNLERESEIGFSARSVVAMDTPERTQIAVPLSKFEDSPVFNYINNLSPIKPVKSAHISQSFSSLSFASLPSVFTSPHASSLKESRILRRHHFSDPSKPELSSENENKCGVSEGIANATHNCSEQQENFEPSSSVAETSMEPSYDCSKVEIEFSRTLTYDCVSPDAKNKSEMASTTSMVPFVPGGSEKGPFGNEVNIEGISPVGQDKATSGCDWGSMIIDASDMLLFESPIVSEPRNESCEKESDFPRSHTNDLGKTHAFDALASSEQHGTENSSQEGGNLKETSMDQELLVDTSFNNFVAGEPSENINDELGSNLNRGMRRRCLVFEMGGSHRKLLTDVSNSGSSTSQTHEITSSGDRSLVPVKPDSSRCIVPGIGLHLNSLAATSGDHNKVAKHENLPSGGQLTIAPPSSASFHSLATGQESVNSLSGATSERGMGPTQNGASIVDDTSKTLGYMVNEELNHSSPKKKRRRVEHAGEPEACKRCNCKKSKCLKLYCECFAAGVYCVEPCSCQDCFNKPIHEDTVLATRKQIESRNPLAFAPKVIRSSDSVIEIGDESNKTPASARHKRGCNCKKSGCLKKYCECYQGGVGCSINCRCEGCKNAFGRKDGSEAELEEEDEMDECERSVIDRSMQKAIVPFDTEQNSTTPGTPLRFGRQSIQLPMSSSKGKPPRSFLAIGSSGIHTIQRFGKPNPIQLQGQFGKHFQTVNEQDEMPEILQGNGSPPISGIKSASPNRKRVSPPHCSSIRLSPGQRSSRKLILQSIPSFPSLTPKH